MNVSCNALGRSIVVAAATVLMAASAAQAAPLGVAAPLSWQGTSAQTRIIDFRPSGTGINVFGTDSNLGVPNSASATDTGDISANLESMTRLVTPNGPYSFYRMVRRY